MRRLLIAAGGLLAMCWRQSPGKTLAAVGLMIASGTAMPLAGISLRQLVNAALDGRIGEAVLLGVLIAVLLIAALTCSHFAHIAYYELAELNMLRYNHQLITLANGSSSLEAHENPEYADRLTVLEREVLQTRNTLQALLATSGLAFGMLLTAVMLAFLHPVLFLLPLLAVPPILAGRRAEQIVDASRGRTAEPTRRALNLVHLTTASATAKELKVFQLEDEVRRRHSELWDLTSGDLWRAQRRATLLRALSQLVFATGYVSAVLLVAHGAITGRSTVGDVVLVVVLASQVNSQVAQVVALVPDLQRLSGVDRRLRELQDALGRPAPAPDAGTAAPDRLRSGITLRGLSFAYPGTEALVLRDVDLHLPAGATVAVVGENGAGKSSLVKMLCGFYRPTHGDILVDGTPLRAIPSKTWHARMSAGFQDFARYEFVVRQTVGVGDLPRESSESAVVEALRRAHAEDVLAPLPDGLGTQLGKSYSDGAELSGGQWQKLALGRAFMRDRPLLLVLDEPTAALDAEAEDALFKRYITQARKIAADGGITLLVSHRFSTISTADMIVVVADGRVAEAGDHGELIRRGGLYAELYALQARGYR
ncbi:ABC transporter ATP-binding protein [Nocardiopsis tropica]|uniref:ABC transporter ATP-binding protein n=1 Tax=Nocardiopsis tropica TaxID=109330 RepID=A0ABV1ZRH2_9ACTN